MFFCYIDPGSGFTVLGGFGWLIGVILLPFLVTIGIFFKKIFQFFLRYKKILLLLLLVILSIAAIIVGVYMKKEDGKFDKRIVILGMDGLSPVIVERLMAEGKLPHFAQLKEKGSYAHLATTNPSQSPVAWTGLATGKNPGKHGIADFIKRDPKTFALELATTQIRGRKVISAKKGDSFWTYASRLGIPSVILSYPVTFPPEELKGRMLSGMGSPDILGTQGTFTFYTTEPARKDKDVGGKVFHVSKDKTKLLNLIGPRAAQISGKSDNLKIPFKVAVAEKDDSVTIDVQNTHLGLKKGRWSDWVTVTFNAGLLKKIKGILKFYLVATKPDFKLYVSPINLDPRNPYFPISYPKEYSVELAKEIGLFYTQGMPADTWSINENRLTEEPFLEQVNEVLREKKAMLDFEFNRFVRGLLFCYFESPDIIQHMFWRYTDPEHPLYNAEEAKLYREVITGWYQKMDAVVGDTMRKMKEDDTLIVLSDHGFDTFRRAVHVNRWLRENGYLTLTDPDSASGRELLIDIDWSKTKAYAIGFGSVYLNQAGREAKGTVRPGEETERLKKELSDKLLEWKDEKNQQPIVSSVYRKEEIFWGPLTEQLPDLYLGFNIGYRASWQTALGAVPEIPIEDNMKKWSGSHLFDPKLIPGVFFMNKNISKKDPSLYDITPTIVKIIGMDEAEIKKCDFDGEPLF